VPSQNKTPIKIKGITYIPVDVKPIKKINDFVPIKGRPKLIKIKGVTLIPAAPLVIAGHTYIPFTTI
jgi:hypothetical protein